MGETFLRALHTLGIALFVGTIAGYVVAGGLAGPIGSASFLQVREFVANGTAWVTIPASGLILISALGLAALSRDTRRVWARVTLLALVIVGIGSVVVAPAAFRSHDNAVALAKGELGATVETIAADKSLEDTAGGVNLLLTLALIGLGAAEASSSRRRPLTS